MEVDDVDTRTELNVLSICSGYGGIELGLHAALAGRTRTICYVENEIGAASILAARMEDGSLDPAPIWTDIRTFDPEPWRGLVSLVAGGFPCQPFSFAGKRLQSADERNLWPDVARIIDGIKPDRVFLENVSGILRYYHERIRRDLREMAYEVAEGLFTAAETGAPHKRERLFILAHAGVDDTEHNGLAGPEEPRGVGLRARHGAAGEVKPEQPTRSGGGTGGDNELARADHGGSGENLQPPGLRTAGTKQPPSDSWKTESREDDEVEGWGDGDINEPGLPLYPPGPSDQDGWAYMLSIMPEVEPTFCRDADGAPTGVDRRLRAIGNGVVPAVAAKAFRELSRVLRAG